eukprot:TRINITY_DN4884_c0_g1_i1.p1 TRINITY_DN4884_c0_g1~~TRINITY_DN4884_c0_g1_i1.p1  ORF type:complete len:639 (-),score=141.87 TRINITY_DN4884_c0_g1_i1:82-1998(-)
MAPPPHRRGHVVWRFLAAAVVISVPLLLYRSALSSPSERAYAGRLEREHGRDLPFAPLESDASLELTAPPPPPPPPPAPPPAPAPSYAAQDAPTVCAEARGYVLVASVTEPFFPSWAAAQIAGATRQATGVEALSIVQHLARCMEGYNEACCALGASAVVVAVEDPRRVAGACVEEWRGEGKKRGECLEAMRLHAAALSQLFALAAREAVSVGSEDERRVYPDRHWRVCTAHAAGGKVCALMLDLLDVSERTGAAQEAMGVFGGMAGVAVHTGGASEGAEAAGEFPELGFAEHGEYGEYRDVLTREECDLLPSNEAEGAWMKAHGFYRHDMDVVSGATLYVSATTSAESLGDRLAQIRVYANSVHEHATPAVTLFMMLIFEDYAAVAPEVKAEVQATLDWVHRRGPSEIVLLESYPEWVNLKKSGSHQLKLAFLLHERVRRAEVVLFRDLDIVVTGDDSLYHSPRHLRQVQAGHARKKYLNSPTAAEWDGHDIPENRRTFHSQLVTGMGSVKFFWHNSGVIMAPGYIIALYAEEMIARIPHLSPKLSGKDMFLGALAFHRLWPPFRTLPPRLNYPMRAWTNLLCKLSDQPILAVHYHKMDFRSGAPMLKNPPKCAVSDQLEKDLQSLRVSYREHSMNK